MKNPNHLILLLFLVLSCKESPEKTNDFQIIEVDIKNVAEKKAIQDIFDGSSLITLRLPEEEYLGVISDIKYFKKRYFILDAKSSRVFIFDKDGNFLKVIDRRGDGPKEYYGINFFDINKKLGSIDIMDIRRGRITRFDLEGDFLESYAARLICRDFAIAPSGEYLFFCPDEPVNPESSIQLNSGVVSLNLEEGYKSVIELGDPTYVPIITGKSFFETAEGVGLLSTYSDTLYLIGSNAKIDKTFIDYGAKVDEAAFTKTNFDFREANFPFLKFFPANFGNYFYYFTGYKEKIVSVLLNPSEGKSEVFLRWDSEKNGLFIPFRGFGTGGQYIVPIDQEMILQVRSYYDTEEPSNEDAKKSLDSLDEQIMDNNCNPLLMIYSPKKGLN